MIHFDGVKWTIFGAQAAVHTNIGIYVEFGRVRDGSSGGWVGGADDPDALRWADLGADTAGGAQQVLLAVRPLVVDQEGHEPKLFRNRDFLFRVLDSENSAGILAGAVGNAALGVIASADPAQIIQVGFDKPFEADTQTLQNTFTVHVAHFSLLVPVKY